MAPRPLLISTVAIGCALWASSAPALSPGMVPVARAAAGAASPEPLQIGDRSLFRAGDEFFDRYARRYAQGGRRSLFRPYPFQFGPHYEPPGVVYEPPPVTYEPPSVVDRNRCAPRTRAWYKSCAARYRSFDPNSGTYTTYSGQQRLCRCP